ncbi:MULTISPECIES: hypothetical protein [unclassified Methylobacterium]|jgi:hypothetical protein|uniref:hypothetical protein n=1 Tax=unclassified Methylobacterium TaxID=2615210 RepID=UPI00135275B6|nr:hypothetical protein [Methylobacterium sp. 2A]MWV21760.1 hypothetical protein [Methylobacterium sp. 2A]
MNLHDPNLSYDPDRLVGELFRRLSSLKGLGIDGGGFSRAVQAALVALGRAAHEEGERRARALAERTGPRPTDVRVTAHARRVGDPDGFDIAD